MAQAIERIHEDTVGTFSRSWDQSEAETAALHRRLTDDYGGLSEQDMLAALTEEGAGPETAQRMRNIDMAVTRVLEEISSGRQDSVAELRADLARLTRAVQGEAEG